MNVLAKTFAWLLKHLFVRLFLLKFLEGFFREDVEELALLVFEKLQHTLLLELLAVDTPLRYAQDDKLTTSHCLLTTNHCLPPNP